jgi:hypothetical protein
MFIRKIFINIVRYKIVEFIATSNILFFLMANQLFAKILVFTWLYCDQCHVKFYLRNQSFLKAFVFPICYFCPLNDDFALFSDENGLLEFEPHRRGRIYLRRLSGSGISAAAAEVFLRNQVHRCYVRLG